MKETKGIILAGGNGSRLFPLTLGTSKQLIPVYDKPMIYYPLATLISGGIRDVLIITRKKDLKNYESLLGNGKSIGINISYAIQSKPNGIAESIIIGSDFISDNNVCLILGDNIFYGENFGFYFNKAKENLVHGYSSIFGVKVKNPQDFGVINFDSNQNILSIIEKPNNPKSNFIVSGLYFFTNEVKQVAKNLKPSNRNELEITDVNNHFLKKNKLKLINLDTKISWIDTGTYKSLSDATNFFHQIEKNSNKKVACIEEVAFKKGFINQQNLRKIAKKMENSDYGKYLLKIVS